MNVLLTNPVSITDEAVKLEGTFSAPAVEIVIAGSLNNPIVIVFDVDPDPPTLLNTSPAELLLVAAIPVSIIEELPVAKDGANASINSLLVVPAELISKGPVRVQPVNWQAVGV